MDDISRDTTPERRSVGTGGERSKGPPELMEQERFLVSADAPDAGLEAVEPAMARREELIRAAAREPRPAEPGEDHPPGGDASPSAESEIGIPRPGPEADAGGSDDESPYSADAPGDDVRVDPEDDDCRPQLDADGLPVVPELDGPRELARVLMVLLLSAREGLSLLRLAQACNTTQKDVETGLDRLREDLAAAGLPVEIRRTGDTVRLMNRPDVFPYLQRLRGVKKAERLSPAALETLAVIAYRQPVMRSEIEAIRGVKAGPMLRTLLDHKLVRITGRADVPGRPLQYGTTQQFLDRFGLPSLKDLPSIKELKQLG